MCGNGGDGDAGSDSGTGITSNGQVSNANTGAVGIGNNSTDNDAAQAAATNSNLSDIGMALMATPMAPIGVAMSVAAALGVENGVAPSTTDGGGGEQPASSARAPVTNRTSGKKSTGGTLRDKNTGINIGSTSQGSGIKI